MGRWNGKAAARAAAAGLVAALGVPATPASDINGFLREKGVGEIAVSFTHESYDEFWVGATKVPAPGDLGEVTTRTVSVWAAYGINDRLTLIGTLPFVDAEGDGTAGLSESDLQDITLLAAYRLAAVGSAVRSEFVGALGGRTSTSGYEGNLPVSVGDDTTDALIRFVYMLRTGGFYWSQQVGYDLRSDDAPDGVPIYTELGYTRGRTTYNLMYSKLLADGGTDIGDPGFTFPSNQEEYDRLGGKAYVRINDRFGLSFSGFSTLDGRNTGDSTGASLGFNYRFADGSGQ